MALTVLIKQEGADDLSLTLDAPRIVIGRGKSCEVQLPDPTVSARHACIRMQGGKNLIVDEGSANGISVGSVRLPPHTPRAVADGEMVRVGRVWLELRFGAGVASTPREVRGAALAYLAHQLAAEGEQTHAYLEVLEGPDAGSKLELSEHDRDYVIGRTRDADLRLSDDLASRRHVAVARDGDRWWVRDLGSKRGAELLTDVAAEGELLDGRGAAWCDAGVVRIGDSLLVLRDPLAHALDEMRSASEVKMRSSELDEPPPGCDDDEPVVEAPTEGTLDPEDEVPQDAEEASDEADDGAAELTPVLPPALDRLAQPRGLGYASLDLFVALVAIGLMSLSIAGLMYVLG